MQAPLACQEEPNPNLIWVRLFFVLVLERSNIIMYEDLIKYVDKDDFNLVHYL